MIYGICETCIYYLQLSLSNQKLQRSKILQSPDFGGFKNEYTDTIYSAVHFFFIALPYQTTCYKLIIIFNTWNKQSEMLRIKQFISDCNNQ